MHAIIINVQGFAAIYRVREYSRLRHESSHSTYSNIRYTRYNIKVIKKSKKRFGLTSDVLSLGN